MMPVARPLPVLEGHPPEFLRLSLSGVDVASHDEIRGRGSFHRVLLSAAVLNRGSSASSGARSKP